MALQEMTVCANTNAVFPYQFNAITDTADPEKTVIVTIVMPVGGKETGFYRYPKAGEKVLVDDNGAVSPTYYLMGYLPSTDANNNFLSGLSGDTADDLKKEEGMVLRYQQTGKDTPSTTDVTDRYSEIGFYHRPTSWKPSSDDEEKYADKEAGYPKIDHINIQSTGDIHERAANHHRLQAKRFEILSGVEDFQHKDNNKILPGDIPGDDGTLEEGDVHIRAGNRILIKAQDSIVLQVGRTSVEISDDGFSVRSRMVATALPNVYDAVLELAPRDGVSITGQEVEITGQRSLSIGDGFGGSLETELGVMEIKAREASIEDFDRQSYGFLIVTNGIKFIQSMVSGSMGLSLLAHTEGNKNELEEKFVKAMGHVDFWAEKIGEVVELVEDCVGIKDGEKDWDAFNDEKDKAKKDSYRMQARDAQGKMVPILPPPAPAAAPASPAPKESTKGKTFLQMFVTALDFILEITSAVYATVETIYSSVERADEANDTKNLQDANWKDKLNFAAIVTDNTIIEIALVVIAGLGGMSSSKIELKATGQIILNASQIQHVYEGEFTQCATPSSVIAAASRVPKIVQSIVKGTHIAVDIVNYGTETGYDN